MFYGGHGHLAIFVKRLGFKLTSRLSFNHRRSHEKPREDSIPICLTGEIIINVLIIFSVINYLVLLLKLWGVTLYLTAFTEQLHRVTLQLSRSTLNSFCSDGGKQALAYLARTLILAEKQTEQKWTKLLSGIHNRPPKGIEDSIQPSLLSVVQPSLHKLYHHGVQCKDKTKAPTHKSDVLESHKHPVGKHTLHHTQTDCRMHSCAGSSSGSANGNLQGEEGFLWLSLWGNRLSVKIHISLKLTLLIKQRCGALIKMPRSMFMILCLQVCCVYVYLCVTVRLYSIEPVITSYLKVICT